MTTMNALATCFRAILAAFSPRAAAERARAAALLLFWNHIAHSLDQLDHLLTLWRTNTLPPPREPAAPTKTPIKARAPAAGTKSPPHPASRTHRFAHPPLRAPCARTAPPATRWCPPGNPRALPDPAPPRLALVAITLAPNLLAKRA